MIVLWTAESTAWLVAVLAGTVLVARRVLVGPPIAWPAIAPRWIVFAIGVVGLLGYAYLTIMEYIEQMADVLTR
jgi:hypothetical protein